MQYALTICISSFSHDASGSSHGASGALCHVAISVGRESHLSEFFSCLARLRNLLACLQLFLAFSLVDLLWFRPRPSRTQQCACTADGTCSTSRGFSQRRLSGLRILGSYCSFFPLELPNHFLIVISFYHRCRIVLGSFRLLTLFISTKLPIAYFPFCFSLWAFSGKRPWTSRSSAQASR